MEVHFLAIHCKSLILCPVAFWQISTFCNAFQRFWHNSTLFVYTLSWIFHKPERMCLKVPITDSSTLSLRIAQTLRPLGIIRSMRPTACGLSGNRRTVWKLSRKRSMSRLLTSNAATGRLFKAPSVGPHRPHGTPTLPVCRNWRATRWTAAPALCSSLRCCTTILLVTYNIPQAAPL